VISATDSVSNNTLKKRVNEWIFALFGYYTGGQEWWLHSGCISFYPFFIPKKYWYVTNTRVLNSRHTVFNKLNLFNFWHRSFTYNSNKSPTWCNNFSVYYPDVYLQLNMFRGFSRPSSGAQRLQWQPLVLPSYRGDSRAVFEVGPAGPTTNTARLSPRYEGKTRGCHCGHWAPDDGRENARNMLSCKQTSG
jgi:hypothetical protein